MRLNPVVNRIMVQDWNFVLQVCEAALAFRRVRSVAHHPDKIAAFLISDARLSHSVEYALLLIKQCLDAVSEDQRHTTVLEINERVEHLIRQADGVMLPDGSTSGDVSTILQEILNGVRVNSITTLIKDISTTKSAAISEHEQFQIKKIHSRAYLPVHLPATSAQQHHVGAPSSETR